MKDDYKRRRKAEHHLVRTIPAIEPGLVCAPLHQESLETSSAYIFNAAAQEQEYLVTSSKDWWLEAYALHDEPGGELLKSPSLSDISDAALAPNVGRSSVWHAAKRDSTCGIFGSVAFIAPDVIGCIEAEAPGVVSTWDARSGQCLERVTLLGVHFEIREVMCKISDDKFAAGSAEGHLCILSHDKGNNLHEMTRIRKAHSLAIVSVSFHADTIVTTSMDWSARLWDLKTRRRLAVLYHDQEVHNVTISDTYIVTSSRAARYLWTNGELRIYRNGEGYPLVKILRFRCQIGLPSLLDGDRILYVQRGPVDGNSRPFVRNSLVILDIQSERVLGQINVACRFILDYTVLVDGRVVVVGATGCRGVIATLPHHLRELVVSKTVEKQMNLRRRRLCTLM